MVPSASTWAMPMKWFPRTRGDGPAAAPPADGPDPVPPHPRGWSPRAPCCAAAPAGSPAPAGMVPTTRLVDPLVLRFPRTRGDGPPRLSCRPSRSSVPPHPRGWSPELPHVALTVTGSPAPAGMVPDARCGRGRVRRFPRTRGDGPCDPVPCPLPFGVPPHPRGWSQLIAGADAGSDGSPAPAGMVLTQRDLLALVARFPRTRGDGPSLHAVRDMLGVVPPHPRGWSLALRAGIAVFCGSPAPAGMVPRAQSKGASGPGFPRTRGDGPNGEVDASSAPAVPPHPRGWSRMAGLLPVPPGGSPAPAGMVPSSRPPLCRMRRFPRTRGDGPWYSVQSDVPPMVPPHPRGWSLRAANLPVGTHGSPAPAGMVPSRNKPQSPPARCLIPAFDGAGLM